MARKKIESYIGTVFNYLTVIGIEKGKNRNNFVCRCICGVEKVLNAPDVIVGHTKSCGCKRWEMFAEAYNNSVVMQFLKFRKQKGLIKK